MSSPEQYRPGVAFGAELRKDYGSAAGAKPARDCIAEVLRNDE